MRACGVYRIDNLVNGKCYVGSSLNMAKRWGDHRRGLDANKHRNRKLQRAWHKYGAEAFSFYAVLVCDPDEVLAYEQCIIDALDAVASGYNIAPRAGNTCGRVLSDETRANIAAAQRGKRRSPETLAKLHATMRTPEFRARMSAIKKGVPHKMPISAEHRAALCAAQKNRIISPETRAKMAAAVRGTKRGPHSEETRRKISAAQKGRPLKLEHVEAMRAARARRRLAREASEQQAA